MRKILVLIFLLLSLRAVVRADDFLTNWGDGKAEVDGYTLIQPRYNQNRKGKAVLIFVTEDHSVKERVKIEGDPRRVAPAERFPVLKLNFIKTFQTGIYDYKVLTSVFTRVDRGFELSKASLSVQEWCGHVYQQIVSDGSSLRETLHSYFGGEGDRTGNHAIPREAVFEDAIPILIRELRGTWLEAGGSVRRPCAPSLLSLRFAHKPFDWGVIRIEKAAGPELVRTAFGERKVTRWTVIGPYTGTTLYWVETAAPHRILRWTSDRGEKAELVGSARLPYWSLHNEGDEKYLQQIFPKS